jgi:ABC-2 type transport system ATP-binding protein
VSGVLAVSALCMRYGARRARAGRHALRDVSFSLERGETVAVVGPNGAGKTTLLSIVAGIQAPTGGTVEHRAGADAHRARADDPRAGAVEHRAGAVEHRAGTAKHRAGTDTRPVGAGRRAASAAARVGWVPQQPALYSKLTVAENLELFARLERVEQPHAAVARMLEQTGLRERAGEAVGRLSGGNRQRVNVAIGLIADPPVLALDEPSAALDPAQRERLWQFVTAMAAAGTSVLFSTHNVSEAQRYATRVLVLSDGRLLFDGTPHELLRAGSPSASTPSSLPDGEGARDGGDLERALVRFLRERA